MGGGVNSSQRSNTPSSRAGFSSSIKLFCGCGRVAVRRVAQTQANMGRPFFTCAINKDDYGCCGYFVWVDKLMEWLINSTDEGIETLGLHPGREIERQQTMEGNVSWKSEVDTKISCMGVELKIFKSIVVGLFVMQLVTMMWVKK
ncbi:hypothetical protein QL285_047592 [Trifolium repens]|nr:hypothetical protein QL285_047592 [Trifolium repens]